MYNEKRDMTKWKKNSLYQYKSIIDMVNIVYIPKEDEVDIVNKQIKRTYIRM